MRILVTGADGFVGRHAIKDLADNGHEISTFDLAYKSRIEQATNCFTGDLRNADSILKAVETANPDACLHLGGISFEPSGKDDPGNMLDVNITGTINLLDAFRKSADSARILVVSTAFVYGKKQTKEPLKESDPLAPEGSYAVSKAAADLIAISYSNKFNMHIMTVRPTNHTGPGQSPQFAIASFVDQVKRIANGESKPLLKVGNLECERYFTDVRDIVRAYRLLLEKGRAGESYNISSDTRMKIGTVLEKLYELAGINPKTEKDPDKFRPTDKSPALDISKLKADTGWEPKIEFSQTLQDMLQPDLFMKNARYVIT
ncbi:GDP-mannose 4,6-dehydratase [Verrucomicrobiota bacterium]